METKIEELTRILNEKRIHPKQDLDEFLKELEAIGLYFIGDEEMDIGWAYAPEEQDKKDSMIEKPWNYRILAFQENDTTYFEVHEVYYDHEDRIIGYNKEQTTLTGININHFTWKLNKIYDCKKSPILWSGKLFPIECKVKYKCLLCGMDTFDTPAPHRCVGGFRKRKLSFDPVIIKPYL